MMEYNSLINGSSLIHSYKCRTRPACTMYYPKMSLTYANNDLLLNDNLVEMW